MFNRSFDSVKLRRPLRPHRAIRSFGAVETDVRGMRPRQIRQLIEQTFESLRSTPQRLTRESLLIRDGHYCGHRYESEDLFAVWFLEEQQVKFFSSSGDLLLVLEPAEANEARLRAA